MSAPPALDDDQRGRNVVCEPAEVHVERAGDTQEQPQVDQRRHDGEEDVLDGRRAKQS
ncbi:MAG TPA: hypothetical protein VFD90_03220 [Gaiellales bacterium]|jgi:hypothetical protein|nr:hypothetical protein [Gaiellales bacterium]